LDMRLEEPGVAGGIDGQARAPGKARARERFAHRRAAGAVAGPLDVLLGEQADERAAAEEVAEMPFLVAERRDVDAEMRGRRILGDGARRLERVDDAERA